MSVKNVYAKTLRADGKVGFNNFFTVEIPQNFLSFGFYFRFFACDIRQNIVGYIKRRNARITRAGNRLQGGNENRFDTEVSIERGKRRREADDRAVRIRNDKTFAESASSAANSKSTSASDTPVS